MRPTPFPLPDLGFEPIAPLWAAALEHVFRLPRCVACGTFDWYPQGECRQCRSADISWTDLSGRGALFSWSVVHRALYMPLAPLGPYVSAIITIAEDPSVRFVTRLIDTNPEELHSGMPVEVRFADLGYPGIETGVVAPFFSKAAHVAAEVK